MTQLNPLLATATLLLAAGLAPFLCAPLVARADEAAEVAIRWNERGIRHSERGDSDKAVDAFKMASHVKPEVLRNRSILSELYEVTEQFDEAIEEQRFILK